MAAGPEKAQTESAETAVVVGATGAFGAAIVRRLLAAGLKVLAVSRTASALADFAAAHPGVAICEADVADDSAIAAIRAALTGPVRMAVHGPGLSAAGSVTEIDPAALAQSVNVKAGGLLRLARAVDDRLVPHARLVAVGGHYGLEPTAYACAAGVANAAVINLSRQLSLAYGPRGVTAHVVAPGPADTDRLRKVAANQAARLGVSVDDVIEDMRADSSLGRLTAPEQVAWAVALLLDPLADAMTGSTLMLDAGRRSGLP